MADGERLIRTLNTYEAWLTNWAFASSLAGSNNIHTIVAKCIAWHSWGLTVNDSDIAMSRLM